MSSSSNVLNLIDDNVLMNININTLLSIFKAIIQNDDYEYKLIFFYKTLITKDMLPVFDMQPPQLYCNCFSMHTMRLHQVLSNWIILHDNNKNKNIIKSITQLSSRILSAQNKVELLSMIKLFH